MKTTLALISLLPVAAAFAAEDAAQPAATAPVPLAEAEESEKAITFDLDLMYASKYVFRGIEYTESAFQPAFTATWKQLDAGIWMNQPVTGNYDNEIDFLVNYTFPAPNDWAVVVGAAIYYYPELDDSLDADAVTVEPKISISGPVGPLTPGISFYYDIMLEVATYEATLGYERDLLENLSMELGGAVGYASYNGGGDYLYWSATAGLSYGLGDHWSLSASANYASHDLEYIDKDHFFALAGVTFSF